MKHKLLLAAVVALAPLFARAESQSELAEIPEAKREAWTRATTPREEHQILQRYVGHWNFSVRGWMEEGSRPNVSTGTADFVSILGGKFIKQTVAGTSMGKPFEGLGILGFDNTKERFTSLWMDNMATSTIIGTGIYNKTDGSIGDHGTFSCPMTDSGTLTYRASWSKPHDGSFKYEMFAPGKDGKEFRMMEIVYTK